MNDLEFSKIGLTDVENFIKNIFENGYTNQNACIQLYISADKIISIKVKIKHLKIYWVRIETAIILYHCYYNNYIAREKIFKILTPEEQFIDSYVQLGKVLNLALKLITDG